MTKLIPGSCVALSLAVAACSAGTDAQSGGAPVPFKVGTFERGGQAFVGLVLRDTQVVDISQGNAAFEARNASAPKLTPPADMKQLIAGYETGWKERLAAIARDVSTAEDRTPVRGGGRHAEDSPAGEAVADSQRWRQLRRAHRGHRRPAAADGARAGRTGVGGGLGPGHLGPQGGRHPRQPVPVPEIAHRRHRPSRSDRDATGPDQHRLRVRVQRRHRQEGEVRPGGAGTRPHLRLHRADRRVRSRRPRRPQDGRIGLARSARTTTPSARSARSSCRRSS